jgi:hypothetical protein
LNGATNVTLNNLRVAGQLVRYTSQFPLTTSGIGTLTTTYPDANGQTQNVKAGALTDGATSTDTDQLLMQPVSDTTCTGGGTSCTGRGCGAPPGSRRPGPA